MKIISGDKVSEPFKFYCEQAIWDALIEIENDKLPLKPFTTTFKTNPASVAASKHQTIEQIYLQSHPEQRGAVVVIRIIPGPAAKLFPIAITENEINALPNLRAIKISDLHSEKLENFREDWFRFMERQNRQISSHDLLDFAESFSRKYQDLFVAKTAKGP